MTRAVLPNSSKLAAAAALLPSGVTAFSTGQRILCACACAISERIVTLLCVSPDFVVYISGMVLDAGDCKALPPSDISPCWSCDCSFISQPVHNRQARAYLSLWQPHLSISP